MDRKSDRGATGASLSQGGDDAKLEALAGGCDGYAAPLVEAPGLHDRATLADDRTDYLGDLAPAAGRLYPVAGGSGRADNRKALRRDPSRLVGHRSAEAMGRARRSVVTNRRTRLSHSLGSSLADWLRRTARVHAHLCAIVRLYGNPERAGGQSLQGNAYAARAASGDRTLLHEALTLSIDELIEIRELVEKAMAAATPTAAVPGTKDKVEEMRLRVERGDSLFIKGDGSTPADGAAG